MRARWTRRRFLRGIALAGAVAAAGTACGPSLLIRRARRLRIAFYTDVHARDGAAISRSLAQAAEAIDASRPDLVIAGGDMVQAGVKVTWTEARALWRSYHSMLARLRADVHHAIGNHDLVGPVGAVARGELDPRSAFRTELGLARTYASFDAAGYHFVLLDSINLLGGRKYRGFVDSGQLDWLRADLASIPRERPVVAVTHMPLWTARFGRGAEPGEGPADRVVVNAPAVLDVLETRDLRLVLQGHLHVAEALRRGSTTYLTGGAICGRWWKGDHRGTPPGFALVTLDGTAVGWRYVAYGRGAGVRRVRSHISPLRR